MESIASNHYTTDFTFTSSILNAPPSRNTPPVSSQPQFSISTMQPIPLVQDLRELGWRNYTGFKSEATFTEKTDVVKTMSDGVKLRPDENLTSQVHGSFDLVRNIPKNCVKKHLEAITTIPNWCNHEDRSCLCNLMSSIKEAWSDFFQADGMQVPPVNEMHADEVNGGGTMLVDATRSTNPKPVIFYKETPALDKDEKQVEPIQSEKIEVENAELVSRPQEIELKSNEAVERKSDLELDVDLSHEIACEIYNLHLEAKARREWAQEKALQAAVKITNDSLELRTLRMKREIAERMRKDIKTKQDKLVELTDEMEQMVKTTQGRAESAQMEVTRLEKENREMQAEIEAARLEKSENDNKCKRLEKKLKRTNKGLEMSEKEMLVLQGEVNKAKKDNAQIEEQIEEVKKEISASEAKLEEEKKLKEQAVKLVEAEHKATISAKNSNQTRFTILTRKMDLDRRRHIEQVNILEREISRWKRANSSSAHNLAELCRPCISCKAAEASVVFLPCAHQVVCAECGKDHMEIGREKCPCCRVRVEERIFVYGLGA